MRQALQRAVKAISTQLNHIPLGKFANQSIQAAKVNKPIKEVPKQKLQHARTHTHTHRHPRRAQPILRLCHKSKTTHAHWDSILFTGTRTLRWASRPHKEIGGGSAKGGRSLELSNPRKWMAKGSRTSFAKLIAQHEIETWAFVPSCLYLYLYRTVPGTSKQVNAPVLGVLCLCSTPLLVHPASPSRVNRNIIVVEIPVAAHVLPRRSMYLAQPKRAR